MDTIERARELFALGRHRAALDLLRPKAAGENAPFDNRRALAELYREMGCPDQAGRWGIILDGWTTEFEQDRLARLLAANGVSKRSARSFLAVPSQVRELPALNALLEQQVPAYRERFRAAAAGPAMSPSDRAGGVAVALGVMAALSAVAGLVLVFIVALFGGGARPMAGGSALLVGVLTGLAVTASGFERFFDRRFRQATLWIAAGILLLGLIAACAAFVVATS